MATRLHQDIALFGHLGCHLLDQFNLQDSHIPSLSLPKNFLEVVPYTLLFFFLWFLYVPLIFLFSLGRNPVRGSSFYLRDFDKCCRCSQYLAPAALSLALSPFLVRPSSVHLVDYEVAIWVGGTLGCCVSSFFLNRESFSSMIFLRHYLRPSFYGFDHPYSALLPCISLTISVTRATCSSDRPFNFSQVLSIFITVPVCDLVLLSKFCWGTIASLISPSAESV